MLKHNKTTVITRNDDPMENGVRVLQFIAFCWDNRIEVQKSIFTVMKAQSLRADFWITESHSCIIELSLPYKHWFKSQLCISNEDPSYSAWENAGKWLNYLDCPATHMKNKSEVQSFWLQPSSMPAITATGEENSWMGNLSPSL